MGVARAAALLFLFTLVASESGAETESKPHKPLHYNPLSEDEDFLDPKWLYSRSVKTNALPGGMKMHTMEKGDGRSFPERGDLVTVQFLGFIHETGRRYENHRGTRKPYTFMIGGGHVIKGWDEGVTQMSLGQRALLHIPSQLAYGPFRSGSGRVPPNSDVSFDIELMGIKKGSTQLGMDLEGNWAEDESLSRKELKEQELDAEYEQNKDMNLITDRIRIANDKDSKQLLRKFRGRKKDRKRETTETKEQKKQHKLFSANLHNGQRNLLKAFKGDASQKKLLKAFKDEKLFTAKPDKGQMQQQNNLLGAFGDKKLKALNRKMPGEKELLKQQHNQAKAQKGFSQADFMKDMGQQQHKQQQQQEHQHQQQEHQQQRHQQDSQSAQGAVTHQAQQFMKDMAKGQKFAAKSQRLQQKKQQRTTHAKEKQSQSSLLKHAKAALHPHMQHENQKHPAGFMKASEMRKSFAKGYGTLFPKV